MKRNRIIALFAGAALLLALLTFSMTYSVRFNEVALITTFGSPGDVVSSPGLHAKLLAPIQAAKTFDTRLQLLETRLETQATNDGLQVVVQTFLFWRIDDSPEGVRSFNQNFGSIDGAREKLEGRLRSAAAAIGEFAFDNLVGQDNRLAEAEQRIAERLARSGAAADGAGDSLADMGVKIEQVGLSQVLLPVETTKGVVIRMKEERQLRANGYLSAGQSMATSVTSEAAAKADRIRKYAERYASKLRARGDELAGASIEVMNQDPEFAVFLLWLSGLERTTQGATTFFLPPTMEPFHLLNFDQPKVAGIPKPQNSLPQGMPTDLARDGGALTPTGPNGPAGGNRAPDQNTEGN